MRPEHQRLGDDLVVSSAVGRYAGLSGVLRFRRDLGAGRRGGRTACCAALGTRHKTAQQRRVIGPVVLACLDRGRPPPPRRTRGGQLSGAAREVFLGYFLLFAAELTADQERQLDAALGDRKSVV